MDFPYGEIVDRLPQGSNPPESWPEFGLTAGIPPICEKEEVGTDPHGIRWSLWPLTFEEYISDTEPDLAVSAKGNLARNRLIIWKRISKKTSPAGWRESSPYPWRIDGFHSLSPAEPYEKKWHHNARRDLKVWRERFLDAAYAIETVSEEEFDTAYRKSTIARKIGTSMLSTMQKRRLLLERDGQMELWGVRNRKTGAVIAGTAALFSPGYRSSVRECPFMLAEARGTYASTGLIGHWFENAQGRDMETLFFTSFWHPGEPSAWKGFSEFKSHFGLEYVAYPRPLMRFESGKLF